VSQQQSLSADEAERVKEALLALRDQHESQVELAKALVMPDGHTVSQQVLSSIMNGYQPAGVSVARAVAARMGITFDELVSGRRLVDAVLGPERNETVPGWKEAAAEVVEKGYAPRYAVRVAGKMWVTVRPERATPAFVYDLAMLWMRHAPLALRIAAEREDRAREERPEPEEDRPAATSRRSARSRSER
jgi:hypothetical protein